mmetsp:Transcript_26663/g.77591  ORF Transcript_26663/g.77591 Transcript_26663/m.77591 type:complete len:98 (+) Transcript_26663:127-420(+)
MHPLVRDLFKRFIIVGREYPIPPPFVRDKAAKAFEANAHLTDFVEVKRAVARGRWMVRELIGVIQLKKYRTMRKRYASANDGALESVERLAKEAFGV